MSNDLSLYYEHRDELKDGDLLQFSGNSVLSRLIRWKTRSEFSHSALVIWIKDSDRIFTQTAEHSGVSLIPLSVYLEKYDGDVYWYPLKDEWESKRLDIKKRALDFLGTSYDFKSLAAQLLFKVEADTSTLFCSESCFLCYGMEGIAPNPGELPSIGIFKDPTQLIKRR